MLFEETVFGKEWFFSAPMRERWADIFQREKSKLGYETMKVKAPGVGQFIVKYRKNR